MIKAQNFRGGLEVIGRINMEVGRLMEERHEIQTLLNRHVTEGLAALENYHDRLMKWFSEEQRLFASNMALSARAVQKMETDRITGEAAEEVGYGAEKCHEASRRADACLYADAEGRR